MQATGRGKQMDTHKGAWRFAMLRLWMAVVVTGLLPARAGSGEEGLDYKAMLDRHGVRLVAVDFYAETCAPCKAAAPRWKALLEKYQDDGLRVIAVQSMDADNAGKSPGWTPDELVPDPSGMIARQLGVASMPAAFLWSWEGRLLVSNSARIEDIEAAVANYMAKRPRVHLKVSGKTDQGKLRDLVTAELSKTKKLDVVAGEADKAGLEEIRRASHDARNDERSACQLGKVLAANSVLSVNVNQDQLSLHVTSAEDNCQYAAVTARWRPQEAAVSVAEAVDKLIAWYRKPLSRPTGAAHLPAASAQTGTVFFHVEPAGSRYTIDGGASTGELTKELASIKLPLRKEPYAVRITRSGHIPFEAMVRLDEGTPYFTVKTTLQAEVQKAASGRMGMLDVKSKPERAAIFLDGVLQTKATPATFSLSSGRYAVRIVKPPFKDWTGTVDVPAENFSRVDETLAADFGLIDITAEPSTAEIFLNGARVGSGGRYRNERQPSGGYAVRVTAPMHHEHVQEILIKADGNFKRGFELKPAWGGIELDIATQADDGGAAEPVVMVNQEVRKVDVNGKRSGGKRRFTIEVRRVRSGTAVVEVQLPGFHAWTGEVLVRDEATTPVHVMLAPRFGFLAIDSTPPGAEVVIDGRDAGRTPFEQALDVGNHTVLVRHGDAWREVEQGFTLESNERKQLRVQLVPRLGAVLASSQPPDAELLLDGQRVGVSPARLEAIAAGSHKLEVRKAGWTPKVAEVMVKEGETAMIQVELDRLGALDVACKTQAGDDSAVTVEIDGKASPGRQARFEGLANGEHVVACIGSAGRRVTRTVTVRESLQERVEMDLSDPTVLYEAWQERRSNHRTAAWIGAGSAVLGAMVLGVGYAQSASEADAARASNDALAHSTSEAEAAAHKAAAAGHVSSQTTYGAVGWVGAGAAVLGVAGTLWALASSPDKPADVPVWMVEQRAQREAQEAKAEEQAAASLRASDVSCIGKLSENVWGYDQLTADNKWILNDLIPVTRSLFVLLPARKRGSWYLAALANEAVLWTSVLLRDGASDTTKNALTGIAVVSYLALPVMDGIWSSSIRDDVRAKCGRVARHRAATPRPSLVPTFAADGTKGLALGMAW